MSRYPVLLALAALVFGCADQPEAVDHSAHAGAEVLQPAAPAATSESLYLLETPWTDSQGVARTLSYLEGRPQLVAMTYTSCEVSCPVIVASLKRLEGKAEQDVGLVLLSLDPDRDTPERMAAYAEEQGLSDRWTLLTAPAGDVLEMAALLGVRYRRLQDGEYAHSNTITVLDAHGVLRHRQEGLGPGLETETLAVLHGL